MHPHDRWISHLQMQVALASNFTEARKTLSISSSCRVFNSPLVNRSNTACSSAVVCTRPIPAPLISNELWNPYSIIRRESNLYENWATQFGPESLDRPDISWFPGWNTVQNEKCWRPGRVGSPQEESRRPSAQASLRRRWRPLESTLRR